MAAQQLWDDFLLVWERLGRGALPCVVEVMLVQIPSQLGGQMMATRHGAQCSGKATRQKGQVLRNSRSMENEPTRYLSHSLYAHDSS